MLVAAGVAQTANFFVVGQIRSGTAIVQSALAHANGVACHRNLFHADEEVRRTCHEDYFGASEAPHRFPTWFTPEATSHCAMQYLFDGVFNHPRRDEQAIGVRLTYAQLAALDVYDVLSSCRFKLRVVHVQRNPLACFISWRQASHWRHWEQLVQGAEPPRRLLPVHVEPDEAVDFVRAHEAIAGKLRHYLNSKCHFLISYAQLLTRYSTVMDDLRSFLKLRTGYIPAPRSARLRHCGDFSARVTNWAELQRCSGLRSYFRDLI